MPGQIRILPLSSTVSNPSLKRADVLAGLTHAKEQTKRRISEAGAWVPKNTSFPAGDLPDNAHLDHSSRLDENGWDPLSAFTVKYRLPAALDKLTELAGRPPIILIRDACFVNDHLEAALKRVLGEEGFFKYVTTAHIDWDYGLHSTELDDLPEKTVVIIGGSFSDTYSIPLSKYSSKFVQTLARTMRCDPDDRNFNRRLLGICFGNQLLANVLAYGAGDERSYGLTVKGFGQFGPFPCEYAEYASMPAQFQRALAGVTDLGGVRDVTSFFTRTGHQKFNIVDPTAHPVYVLGHEMVGGGITTWGSRNFRALGEQSHPEITLTSAPQVSARIAAILERSAYAKECYGRDVSRTVLENFQAAEGILKADLSTSFYLHALCAMAEDVATVDERRPKPWKNLPSQEAKLQLLTRIRMVQKVDEVGTVEQQVEPGSDSGKKSSVNFKAITAHDLEMAAAKDVDDLLSAGKMDINTLGDWEVNRGAAQISQIMGVRIIPFEGEYLDRRAKLCPDEATVIVDMGPGDGTFMRDLRDDPSVAEKNKIVIGIGDRAYVDVEACLKQIKPESAVMPDPCDNEQVLRLVTQNIVERISMALVTLRSFGKYDPEISKDGILKKILKELQLAKANPNVGLGISGMFENEGRVAVNANVTKFLTSPTGIDAVQKLVDAAADPERFARAVGREFRNILIGQFLNFDLPARLRIPIHLSFASRSTSHVDPSEYYSIIDRFVGSHAADGAVAFENGVYQSYTLIPRLAELSTIQKKYAGRAEIAMVYDQAQNQFKCAAIMVAPDDWLRTTVLSHVDENSAVVSLNEAAKSTFFRLESLMRRFVYEIAKGVDGIQNVRGALSALHESTAAVVNYLMDVVWGRSACAQEGLSAHLDERERVRIVTATLELAKKFTSHLRSGSQDEPFPSIDSNERRPLTATLLDERSDCMDEGSSQDASSATHQSVGAGKPTELTARDVRLYQDETGESLEAIFKDPVFFPAWMNPRARRKY